ncbi:hypothetical protein A3J43_03645 [Candidatus Uhrbacteria bacterium RIFCSPHIGHO2_12_FULL_54_23]|uniref:Uncharacterized protein n=1 Tax=Candidatus Uhrbacteria bacterium RIFCSPHIGHO2_12_FULL_54_23 TaxID=1802397 RepID=A0A1F7UKK2_9BACT|nr:MAG: hypothetical protein A3J43_03645 [Candidatus Uhrbacteria bacterium RIFCSPHIGHO2_12_FULL_54_23]
MDSAQVKDGTRGIIARERGLTKRERELDGNDKSFKLTNFSQTKEVFMSILKTLAKELKEPIFFYGFSSGIIFAGTVFWLVAASITTI